MVGLRSQDAQHRLHLELQQFASNCSKINWFNEFLHSPSTPISSILTLIASVSLIIEFFVSSKTDATTLIQAIVLIGFAVLNLVLFAWELRLLKTRRIRRLLSNVRPFLKSTCPWTARSYPKTPLSTLRGHFTVPAYRDGSLVNLPTSLLVQGDIVELHRDVPSPAKVSLLSPNTGKTETKESRRTSLELGGFPPVELYNQTQSMGDTDTIKFLPNISSPQWVVQETPITSLLESNVTKRRPKTLLTKEKNRIVTAMEILVVIFFVISLLYNAVRYFVLASDFDNSWPELLLRQPVYTVLPILVVPLPLVWTIVNLYGTASVTLLIENEARFSSFQKRTIRTSLNNLRKTVLRMFDLVLNNSIYPNYRAFHILGSLTSVCAVDKEYVLTGGFPTPEKVFILRTEEVAETNFEMMSSERRERSSEETTEQQSEVKSPVASDLLHEDSCPSFHVTSLDTDKETESTQLLSLRISSERFDASNPLTGKSNVEDSPVAQTPNLDSLNAHQSKAPDSLSGVSQFSDFAPFEVMKEILDVSPSIESASGVCFDDVNWQIYMGSLKPIGVCLLATSHLSKQSHKWHLSSVLAQLVDQTSCSCSLGMEIGVSDYASYGFEKQVLLYSYGEVSPLNQRTLSRRGNSNLSSCSSCPVHPHIMSLVMKDVSSSNYFLMSRGSGDMVTSCCSDFWDGKDLQPMTDMERTTIMEFYNRRSTTGYCIALAYNPLLEVNLASLQEKNFGMFVPAVQMYRSYSEMNVMFSTGDGLPKLSTAPQVFGLLQCHQVFLGLLSFQFKPKLDIVALIEDLQVAGIRFVHFTSENEVRGKVFAQKLGLEADWNCHISLAPDVEQGDMSSEGSSSDLGDSRSSSVSSLSSYMNTNMSNYRAKLPVGIDSVRPHIENVDNVPLLVPLFTDCSTDTIRDMIEIMQENSEVVLCIGNAWNRENLPIFSQADISLSLIPEYVDNSTCFETETCALSTSNSSQNTSLASRHQLWPSPLEMAAHLNSTTSQLCFNRERDVSLLSLITESRHIQSVIRHGFLFGLGSYISLVLLMLVAELFFIPPPLDGSHLFWFVFLVIPLISLSFLSIPTDPRIKSQIPARKKQILSEKHLFLFNFALSFVPTVAFCELMFGLTLTSICSNDIPNSDCHLLLGDRNISSSSNWNGWRGDYEQGLILSQDLIAFFLCLYFVALSLRFIHRTKPLWKLSKYVSWQYISVLVGVIVLQVVYFAISQAFATNVRNLSSISGLSSVPFYVWIIGFLWPVLIVIPQELLKYHDKSRLFKLQTHLKLEFETRLGMYSPM